MSAFKGLLHHFIDAATQHVPCNYGCGTLLPVDDTRRAERIAHFEDCPNASALVKKTAGLIKQNYTQTDAHAQPQEA